MAAATETYQVVRYQTDVIVEHAGGSGIAYLWEQQLLNTPVQAVRLT